MISFEGVVRGSLIRVGNGDRTTKYVVRKVLLPTELMCCRMEDEGGTVLVDFHYLSVSDLEFQEAAGNEVLIFPGAIIELPESMNRADGIRG